MRGIRLHGRDGIDAMKLEEFELLAPGPGEARIAVHAAGVNFGDTLMVTGQYQEKPDLPFSPGMEAAGEVLSLGDGVDYVAVGARVMGSIGYGGFAEEANVPAANLTLVPDDMDWVTAAAFPVAYGTSHVALTYRSHLKSGEVLLVHGAAGGVGLTAVELGKAMGATVIATAGSDDKVKLAKSYGADYGINYSHEDIREKVLEYTAGADVIYDPGGGDAFKASLRCIKFEGRIIVIGFASGDIPQIPTNYPLVKCFTVDGFVWGAYHRNKIEVIHDGYRGLSEIWATGALKPHISKRYPLANTAEAMRLLLARKSSGKVVIESRQ